MTDKQVTKDDYRSMVNKFETITTGDPNLNLNEQTGNDQAMSKVKHSSSMNSIQDRKNKICVDDNWTPKDLPGPNVPERILFVVDTAKEADCTQFETRASAKFSPLYMIKRVIGIFVNVKLGLNQKHEFALMTLNCNGVTWICNFTNNRKSFISELEKIQEDPLDEDQSVYDLGPCFDEIISHPEMEENGCNPNFVTRVILLYARSSSIPHFLTGQHFFVELMSNQNFFLDSLYVHEPLSEDNKCQEVYAKLALLDTKQTSYILEAGRNLATLHTNMAKLLAHPLQRARQDDAPYTLYNPGSPQEVQTNV